MCVCVKPERQTSDLNELYRVNVTKCPAKSTRKPPVCNSRVSVCIWVIFRLGFRVTFYLFKDKSLWPLLSLLLARSDGEVYEKGDRTFYDAY